MKSVENPHWKVETQKKWRLETLIMIMVLLVAIAMVVVCLYLS